MKQVLNTLIILILLILFINPYKSQVFAQPWPGIMKEKVEETSEEPVRLSDPLKSYNRAIFQFNDKLYFYVLKPVAKGYKAILPEQVRTYIRNAISNARMPVRVINCILQRKFCYTADEITRFAVNTTFGMAGLFDPAYSCLKIEKHEEDLGQTLGFYGISEIIPITWPFLGPSNLRDTLGLLGDAFTDPLLYVEPILTPSIATLNTINETSLTLGEYEKFKESAIDPYISMTNAYTQYRKSQIKK